MAPVVVDPGKVREFATRQAFYDWLATNHETADEIWIRIFKKASGKATMALPEPAALPASSSRTSHSTRLTAGPAR